MALGALLAPYQDELTALRRDVHAHPEIGRQEHRTTALLVERLHRAGLRPEPLPGTGLVCDLGDSGPLVALRADLDALQIPEETGLPWSSTRPGVCHACGHDVHLTALLGAGLVLADLWRAGRLPGRVRLIFQPAEEVQPGGALDVIAAGGLDGVEHAFAVHCDPRLDVGCAATRAGAITAAADIVTVRLSGRGGHTSRPHLGEDLVFALAQVVTQVPAALSRLVDPRAGLALVWGSIQAGLAANAMPTAGELRGTLRCLDTAVWARAGALLGEIVHDVVRPYGVRAEVEHRRGVPPTINDRDAVRGVVAALQAELGEGNVMSTDQSLGGEDFAWMLEKAPGAMVRLGTRTPGGLTHDLHQGTFRVDEAAIGVGARVYAAMALQALGPAPAAGSAPAAR